VQNTNGKGSAAIAAAAAFVHSAGGVRTGRRTPTTEKPNPREGYMNIILFGATGMVGQGVLRECLLDPEVAGVLVITRSATGVRDAKVREIVHRDFFDFSPIAEQLAGYDACLFCLGVSSAGMKEAEYRRLTYDMTIAAARAVVERNPGMTFIYVSGAGTDSTERGRSMWARVKGQTENELLRMPFKAAYMFRPGYIQPMHGIRSKTGWYRAMYAVVTPLYPLLQRLFPAQVTTTEQLGRAMVAVAKRGAPKRILETIDISTAMVD
jgi:uncharacterized protein YbjT (DUF2867 family)